ncbi:FGF22 factor, partial [Nothocercus nigrocapillus]|nr:FGF22 factor [Nothocercus nigrocapillus]
APAPGSAAWGGRRPPRSYGHLEGDVRWRRLFSATRFFLRIDSGGGVEGTRWREQPGSECGGAGPSWAGGTWEAPGIPEFGPSCMFQERIEENGYNTYASLRWRHRGRPVFVSLDGRGRPLPGRRTRRHHLSTHFLPTLVA